MAFETLITNIIITYVVNFVIGNLIINIIGVVAFRTLIFKVSFIGISFSLTLGALLGYGVRFLLGI